MTFYEKMAVIMYIAMMLIISFATCLYSSGKEKPAFGVLCLAVTLSGMLGFLSIVN